MPHYQNSVIYKIKHNEDYDDTNIYVGSTSNFKNRKNCHKSHCNNEKDKHYNLPVYQYIRANGNWEQFVMIPIEEYSCNSKNELEIRERYHIDLLRPTLNKIIPTRTSKEYRDDNKEVIKEKKKQDYIDNREYKLLKQKIYADNHKEKIAEKGKEYRLNNKEKINETKKIYNTKYRKTSKRIEWATLKIKCDICGSEVSRANISTHQKSKKCINFVKS